jgi:hypothetical protein
MNAILTTTRKVKIDKFVRENVQRPNEKEEWEKILEISRTYSETSIPGRMTMIKRENGN